MKTSLRIAILAIFLSGCFGGGGPPVYPVSGTLTKGGKPLANVKVYFTPESGPVSTGLTNSEGKFVLITQAGKAGAVAGKHKVTLVEASTSELSGPIDMSDPATRDAMMRQRDQALSSGRRGAPAADKSEKDIPPEYSDLAKTPFEISVDVGGGTVDLPIP